MLLAFKACSRAFLRRCFSYGVDWHDALLYPYHRLVHINRLQQVIQRFNIAYIVVFLV